MKEACSLFRFGMGKGVIVVISADQVLLKLRRKRKMNYQNFKYITIVVPFLFISGVSSGRITDEGTDGLQNDLCPQEGQFLSGTTQSCEKCSKYCPNGKNTPTCPVQCLGYMDKIKMDQESEENGKVGEKEITKLSQPTNQPSQPTEPVGYLVPIAVFVVVALLIALIIKQCRKQRCRPKQILDNNHNNSPNPGIPNPPIQEDPPNPGISNPAHQNGAHYQIAPNCKPLSTHRNGMKELIMQETREAHTFVPDGDNREEEIINLSGESPNGVVTIAIGATN